MAVWWLGRREVVKKARDGYVVVRKARDGCVVVRKARGG